MAKDAERRQAAAREQGEVRQPQNPGAGEEQVEHRRERRIAVRVVEEVGRKLGAGSALMVVSWVRTHPAWELPFIGSPSADASLGVSA